MRRRSVGLSFLGILFLAATGRTDCLGPLISDTADPVGDKTFIAQLLTYPFIKVGDFDDSGSLKYLPSGDRLVRWTTVLRPYYGLTDDWEISADIPYLLLLGHPEGPLGPRRRSGRPVAGDQVPLP